MKRKYRDKRGSTVQTDVCLCDIIGVHRLSSVPSVGWARWCLHCTHRQHFFSEELFNPVYNKQLSSLNSALWKFILTCCRPMARFTLLFIINYAQWALSFTSLTTTNYTTTVTGKVHIQAADVVCTFTVRVCICVCVLATRHIHFHLRLFSRQQRCWCMTLLTGPESSGYLVTHDPLFGTTCRPQPV